MLHGLDFMGSTGRVARAERRYGAIYRKIVQIQGPRSEQRRSPGSGINRLEYQRGKPLLYATRELRITKWRKASSRVIRNLRFAYNEAQMSPPALVTQTTYAELLERCAAAASSDAFPAPGKFTSKTVKNRRYWYFQLPTDQGRTQQYVGPETPELVERIAHHREARADERERRALVSALVRSFGLPRPHPQIGEIIAALARAGIFRLRAVLVGTVAYQTYPAMLGLSLPAATLQTGDIDIAQFKNISVAVEDRTTPMLDILKGVDRTFRAIPHLADPHRTTSYISGQKIRVEFLTPNEGRDTDAPQPLPALGTEAQPLRFLDFLIHEPEPAVILHGAGVYVQVPSAQRYAVHKLILSRQRRDSIKVDKDLRQAEALLAALAKRRPFELKAAWEEAYGRGRRWQESLKEGLSGVAIKSRDLALKAVDHVRGEIPRVGLTFNNEVPRYDATRMLVLFSGKDGDHPVQCGISYETLADHFGSSDGLAEDKPLAAFREHRTLIESLARLKYLWRPVEDADLLLLTTGEIADLRKGLAAARQ